MKLTKKQKKYIIELIATLIILIIGIIAGTIKKEEILEILGIQINSTKNIVLEDGEYEIISVVDGDTLKIKYEGKEEKLRLIGIDTPESVHPDKTKNTAYGNQASDYTKKLLENKKVRLEFDVQKNDQYGRLLAYVYLENGEMLNKKLLQEGYAKISTYPPNVKYVEEFKQIQEKARKEKAGFWKENIF